MAAPKDSPYRQPLKTAPRQRPIVADPALLLEKLYEDSGNSQDPVGTSFFAVKLYISDTSLIMIL